MRDSGSSSAERPSTSRSSALSNKVHPTSYIKSFIEEARIRDGGRCAITGEADCEVCHIFPYCHGKNQGQRSSKLWSVLEMFWGGEHTAELKEILYGPHDARRTSINRLGNLITLCHGAHSHWKKGYFALKHISGGGYEMVLELEWLPDHPELSREGVRLDQPVENTSAQFLADHGLFNLFTNQRIYSGYQFTMTTDNTEDSPLPDERLINLQWFLTRILRMSGVAEPVDLNYDETLPMVSPISSVPSLVTSPDTQADTMGTLSFPQDYPPSIRSTVPKNLSLKKWAKRVFFKLRKGLRKGSGNEQVSL